MDNSRIVDEIRNKVQLSDVIGKYIQWDRRKTQASKGVYWASCPFHSEKTASFKLDNEKGVYHCFGCKASGDVYKFIMDKDGLNFPEALEKLSIVAGIELPKSRSFDPIKDKKRQIIYDIMEKACTFYQRELTSNKNSRAYQYLLKREISKNEVNKFRIGYASGKNDLMKHLIGIGYNYQQLTSAGLVAKSEDRNEYYERFRDRLVFPICDQSNKVIAFGGRDLSDKAQAKYLNSPETDLFIKKNIIYNFYNARKEIQQNSNLLVVEGYMDVVALDKVGFKSSVSTMGTSFSEEQLDNLWKISKNPILCFDGDEAGYKAALRSIAIAFIKLKPGFTLGYIFLPPGKDPDDMVRDSGADIIQKYIAKTEPLIDVFWNSKITDLTTDSPELRAKVDNDFDELIATITDKGIQRHYKSLIQKRLYSFWNSKNYFNSRKLYGSDNKKQKKISRELQQNSLARGDKSVIQKRENLILLAAINHPLLVKRNADKFLSFNFTRPSFEKMRERIIDIVCLDEDITTDKVRNKLLEQGFQEELRKLDESKIMVLDSFVSIKSDINETELAWKHVIDLQKRTQTIEKDLKEAEIEFSKSPSEDNAIRLENIRLSLENTSGREAFITGYSKGANSKRENKSLDKWLDANKDRLP